MEVIKLVHRLYTERKDHKTNIRILNRYDIQGLSDDMLEQCKYSVFADPCTDTILTSLPDDADYTLAVEYLPGQYDQRADAAEQCAMLLLGFRPVVRTARVYLFYGEVDPEAIRKQLINPVESREAQLDEYISLDTNYSVPEDVMPINSYDDVQDLAMSDEDLECCKKYFESEGRMPTLTEMKVLDTYWSDHCRHTTFSTQIDSTEIHDSRVLESFRTYQAMRKYLNYPDDKPITLMDIATIGAKYLRAKGLLPDLVLSDENNACTVRIKIDGEDWLLLFKNETHNHPTEIEPYGGAATCIGGAIRDPLSGRAYVYQAMRITGAADPSLPTMPGKLPQWEIITKSAQGYSSYGNQIGIPTGLVDEVYHDGYMAKRLEVGAVIATVPEHKVIRESPASGDCVLLLGGRTGRDGIGGATGSSVSHTSSSIETCGAEVQKGNAPEERKLQRLFRNPEFSRLIKKCNDFGAGGVSVAVGELAEGLDINLDAVPLKYAGLDGTEIAVSESQERMAVVVSSGDVGKVKALALSEDVQATVIARVNDSGRMRMTWRGKEIVNLSREFIDSNGASRRISVRVNAPSVHDWRVQDFPEVLADLNVCSKRGLAERFDSSVGARSVLMPFGGKYQKSPVQAMVAKIDGGSMCSVMSWGFDPYVSEHSAYDGAYLAVVESLCRLAASGADLGHCWLTLQEYFGKPERDPERWGLPFGALLGALQAQEDFGVAAIGGKDSMSGSFRTQNEILDVPPTLIAFAVSLSDADRIISSEFKHVGSHVIILEPEYDDRGLPMKESMKEIFLLIGTLNSQGKILACATPTKGGIISMVFKMCLGNGFGFEFSGDCDLSDGRLGKFIVELAGEVPEGCRVLGRVSEVQEVAGVSLSDAERVYDAPLAEIFPTKTEESAYIPDVPVKTDLLRVCYAHEPKVSPKFLIPVFAGTNCEYETAASIERSGGAASIFVVKTLTPDLMQHSAEEFARSLGEVQALVLPGGFSNGDEPDGSGKFIAIFLRSPEVREALEGLLGRGGLVCGICNGFQALVKTGLLPYGRFAEPEELNTVLTFNRIGRHQSRIVHTKIVAANSPWFRKYRAGDVYSMPISHGEGRFVCSEEIFRQLMRNGQVAAQYADLEGRPSMETQYNPSGSCYAVECLTSPDGRILGRMGHAERVGEWLYKNVPGNYDLNFFDGACEYFGKA